MKILCRGRPRPRTLGCRLLHDKPPSEIPFWEVEDGTSHFCVAGAPTRERIFPCSVLPLPNTATGEGCRTSSTMTSHYSLLLPRLDACLYALQRGISCSNTAFMITAASICFMRRSSCRSTFTCSSLRCVMLQEKFFPCNRFCNHSRALLLTASTRLYAGKVQYGGRSPSTMF